MCPSTKSPTFESPALEAGGVGPFPGLHPGVRGAPEKAALIYRGRRITYGQFCSDVSDVATGLRATLQAGDLLAMWLPDGPDLLTLYLACLRTGVVPMPLHFGMKPPEIRSILAGSQARHLATSAQVISSHHGLLTGAGVQRVYVAGGEGPAHWFRRDGDGTAHAAAAGPSEVSDDDLGLVLHTSGSEGRPKGVMISYRGLANILRCRLHHTGMGSDSVAVVASALTQSVGLYQCLAMLCAGGTVVLLDSYDVDEMAEAINGHRPTHLIMVVDAFDKLLHHPEITPDSFGNIAFASAGADRVTRRVQDRFVRLTGRALGVTYGLTESSWACVNPGDRMDKRLALGKPCPDVDIQLRYGQGREVPPMQVGEITIKSPKTMMGYLGDEQLTGKVLMDGWLATGDLAYRDEDGYFWFAGRSKRIIVLSSGDNVAPVEVENAIMEHPGVANCVVQTMPAPEGAQAACAFVIRSDPALCEADLFDFLKERLSDYKLPARVLFVEQFPVGLTGKRLAEADS